MILCSRLKCGCMASALLSGDGINGAITKKDIEEFTRIERNAWRIVKWEDRESVCAERCPTHEAEYCKAHPDYKPVSPPVESQETK